MSNDKDRSFFAVYAVNYSKSFPDSCMRRFRFLMQEGVLNDLNYIGESGEVILGRGKKAHSKFVEKFGDDDYLWDSFFRLCKINDSENRNLEGFVVRAVVQDEDTFEKVKRYFERSRKENRVECTWYSASDTFTKGKKKKEKS